MGRKPGPAKTEMKALYVILSFSITILIFSFNERRSNAYDQYYFSELGAFTSQQAALRQTIAQTNLSIEENKRIVLKGIEEARIKL
jgi:hypothetical protein